MPTVPAIPAERQMPRARTRPVKPAAPAEPAADEQPAAATAGAPDVADAQDAAPSPEPAADAGESGAFSDREHRMLDAMKTPEDRAGRALLYREWRRTGLDPFAGQIYLREDWSTIKVLNEIGNKIEKQVQVYSVGTRIDGFRVVAHDQTNYRGQTPVQWCDQNGEWKNVWLGGRATPPYAARVGIIVDGWPEPVWGVAIYAEYKPANAGDKSTWVKMAAHMIGIAAEALATRRAYPKKLSGLYTDIELEQRDDADDLTPAHTAPAGPAAPAAGAEDGSTPFKRAALAASALDAVRNQGYDPRVVYAEAGNHQAGNLLQVHLSDERTTLGDVLKAIIVEANAAHVHANHLHTHTPLVCVNCDEPLWEKQLQYGDEICVPCMRSTVTVPPEDEATRARRIALRL